MPLKYKTYDSLMSTVEEDLRRYVDNNLVNRKRYIKTVRTANSDLGLRLNEGRETVLDIVDYKTDLPEDFLTALTTFAVWEKSGGFLQGSIAGTNLRVYSKEELINADIKNKQQVGCSVSCDNSCSSCGGTGCSNCMWISRKFFDKEIIYKDVQPLEITSSCLEKFNNSSPNRNCKSKYKIDIGEDKILVNFEKGTIYLSYLADMVDHEGNLLVLDHPLIDGYYEWAVKAKILEDLYYNNDAPVIDKLKDARQQRDIERNKAIGIVVDQEYREMRKYNHNLLTDFYKKQVRMFV